MFTNGTLNEAVRAIAHKQVNTDVALRAFQIAAWVYASCHIGTVVVF